MDLPAGWDVKLWDEYASERGRAIADGEKGAVGTGHSFILCERERESKNSDFALIEGVG